MANSLEFSVESYFLALFVADPRSAGKKLSHFDEEDTASTNAIVVRAKQGAEYLPADPGCSEVEVTVEYRSPVKTGRAEGDQGAALLRQVIYNSTISVIDRTALMVAAGLSRLMITEAASGERENTPDLRKRTLTVPVVARLT